MRRAIELKPDDAPAHHRYALVLAIEGRCKEGLEQAEKASQLDPTSLVISNFVTASLYCARDCGRAIDQAKKTLELDPRFALRRSFLALSYIGQGRYDCCPTSTRVPGSNTSRRRHVVSFTSGSEKKSRLSPGWRRRLPSATGGCAC